MPTANDMFAHIHRDGLRELELERAQVHQQAETDPQVPSMVHTLREEYRRMLDAIVINAVKLIPKLVEIKPDLVIGWTGPFPSISLSFDLQADSISIHELFKELKGAHA